MKKEIIIKVNLETAETTVEAHGFGGKGCRDATRPYEDALGITGERTSKPEMWQATQGADNTVKRWGGGA